MFWSFLLVLKFKDNFTRVALVYVVISRPHNVSHEILNSPMTFKTDSPVNRE